LSAAEGAIAALRRFSAAKAEPEARCELCGAAIAARHDHLLEGTEKRALRCACHACSLLFPREGTLRYRAVPRRVDRLSDFQLTDVLWESLAIPINMVFFVRGATRVTAHFPSPAGATASELPEGAWEQLALANPILAELEPEVEALLVSRVGTAREHYRVSIDRAFELVGLVRARWRGMSGGNEVWEEVARFFAALEREASCPT
jgi:hypothetical protein